MFLNLLHKKQIIFCTLEISMLLIVGNFKSFSQTNYNFISNYSFEDSAQCPVSLPIDSLPFPWYIPSNLYIGTYVNSCSTDPCLSVPYNCWGAYTFQYARTGNAYVGLFFRNQAGSNARNYVQVLLNSTLVPGKCYYAEFYVSLMNSMKGGCNNISMAITPNQIWADTITPNANYKVISYSAQVYNYGNPIITDTLNWVKVSSVYVAQGGEKYITIGNFKYDSSTAYQTIQSTGYAGAAYYVDDVSVIPLDSLPLHADAGKDTIIVQGDSVFIGSLTNGLTNVVWYNSSGTAINFGIPGFFVSPSTNTFYVIEQTVCGYYSRDTVNVTVNAMPLKLLSFTVQKQDKYNLLTWHTAEEVNTDKFEIERSSNGREYTLIGTVNAGLSNYNFTDHSPFTTHNYYRLKMFDKDGRFTYSPIREANNSNAGFTIYPNPTKHTLNVILSSPNLQKGQLLITDMAGKCVQQQVLQLQQGGNNKVINVASLQNGSYFLKIICANGCEAAQVNKFVKE